ncbi:MAG: hypothetical protein HYX41_02405 [Bdellovibrio sp.]|nr:hypothetical protein [Bdellovibrio sp.]
MASSPKQLASLINLTPTAPILRSAVGTCKSLSEEALFKGINMVSASNNEVVFFGGSDCRDYLVGSTACSGTPASNPGRYWNFGTDPANVAITSSAPSLTTMGGTVPTNAGMATARGLDLNGNPIVVAYGGMSLRASNGFGSLDTSSKIYYLYNDSLTTKPTWGTYTVPTGAGPPALSNASLVYSHVTGKFYLFGGYNSGLTSGNVTNGNSGDTWELSVSSSTPSCGVATSATCNFSWRLLNSSSGLSCYPNCPQARRSHRMVEANYNYFNAPAEPLCTNASQPCSFGLFMTGGTPDGVSYLSDRWMFDPTANGGNGNWQNVASFPPRIFAAMASASYYVPSGNGDAHRAILFGGETAMEDPVAVSSGYFVPPTLGDTWMYDYTSQSWNLVKLYGRRYMTGFTGASLLSQNQAREASLTTDTTTSLLAPPPLSGAIMVTRTLKKASHLLGGAATKLAIPEVFLFGGRGKDGLIQPLSKVYKFCAGSTGEKPYPYTFIGSSDTVPSPDDASCDGYDRDVNPNSSSPNSGYTGRWLYKTPPNTGQDTKTNMDPATVGAFLGAATYDTARDLIILFGGISTPGVAITDTASLSANTSGTIYEYTPPSSSDTTVSGSTQYSGVRAGYWNEVKACQESTGIPTARYAHNLGFDSVSRTVYVAGGYAMPGSSSNGQLLTQVYQDGSTTTPEVWAAVRFDSSNPAGIPGQGIPPVILGDSSNQFPCYYWSQVSQFANSSASTSDNRPPTTGVAHAAGVFIPSSGFNTGYYTMFDQACVGSGPIASNDATINKLLVGGAYFDIDRSQLAANENLILNLTFLPLGPNNQGPDQSFLAAGDTAVFRVNLIRTGQSGDLIRQLLQPRDFTYASTDIYPQVAQKIAVVAPPNGQIRQEQILIPLSVDPAIDRIHVERYSGSGVLIDATLMRMGPR